MRSTVASSVSGEPCCSRSNASSDVSARSGECAASNARMRRKARTGSGAGSRFAGGTAGATAWLGVAAAAGAGIGWRRLGQRWVAFERRLRGAPQASSMNRCTPGLRRDGARQPRVRSHHVVDRDQRRHPAEHPEPEPLHDHQSRPFTRGADLGSCSDGTDASANGQGLQCALRPAPSDPPARKRAAPSRRRDATRA